MTNPIQDAERDKLFGADPLGLRGPVRSYADLAREVHVHPHRPVPVHRILPPFCDAELEFKHHGGRIRRTIQINPDLRPPGVVLCGEGVYLLQTRDGSPLGYEDDGKLVLCYVQDEGGVQRVG